MKYLIVLVMCAVQQTTAVIWQLNDTEYDRLPPLFKLDEFYPCLRYPGDIYCYVDAKLTANSTSEILHTIEEYSANLITHYDHTYIHWGVCLKKSCQDYLNSTDLNTSIEACINSSLYQSHRLQAILVEEKVFCTEFGEPVNIDTSDIVVAVVLITIVVLNLLGTLYDFCCVSRRSIAARFLLCFSAKQNWKRLVAPSGEGPEPRLRRLKLFNGVKAVTTFFVVMGHSPLAALITSNNTHFIELTYYNVTFHIFYNGNLIVQSFFIMSGFLLAFNILLLEEKVKITWNKFPAYVIMRWLRLTPPYAVVLAVTATWMRHFGNGPMWKSTVGSEAEACRRDWYYHILYLNDYVDHSQCMAHSWYIAADMQLTILGLLIFSLLKSQKTRKIAIGVAFAVGIITPAAETFFRNLHGILLTTPEVARNYYVEDPTFNNLYKRGHTNIVCYAMGLALGIWVYNLIQAKVDVNKYKKYRYIYWATFPFGLLLIISGGIFYIDGIQIPLIAQAIYSPIIKMMFGMIGFILVPGTVFKLENVYRGLLEWRGWSVFGRVSYGAYLVHEIIIRYSAANHTSLIHSNFLQILLTYFGLLVAVFVVALPFWFIIEAPFNQLVKLCFYPSQKEPAEIANGAPPLLVINNKELDVYGKFQPKNVPL